MRLPSWNMITTPFLNLTACQCILERRNMDTTVLSVQPIDFINMLGQCLMPILNWDINTLIKSGFTR